MNWSEECKAKAMYLTKEKRQEFMGYIHKGITLGESRERAGIDFDTAKVKASKETF